MSATTSTQTQAQTENQPSNHLWEVWKDAIGRVQVRVFKVTSQTVLPLIGMTREEGARMHVNTSIDLLPSQNQPYAERFFAFYTPWVPQVASISAGLTVAVNPLETAGRATELVAYSQLVAFSQPFGLGELHDQQVVVVGAMPKAFSLHLMFQDSEVTVRATTVDGNKANYIRETYKFPPYKKSNGEEIYVPDRKGMLITSAPDQGFVLDPNTGMIICYDPRTVLTEA
jgi:hypothetical protein